MMKHFAVCIYLILQASSVFSQIRVEGQVFDHDTKKPLPYCNVGILNSTIGTITNSEGKYSLESMNSNDTLACSYIGYQPFYILVSDATLDGKIFLTKSAVSLETTTIMSNNFIYDLVANCRKTSKPKPYTAKTYFELDSYMEGQPVEMIECYYNGNYYGTNIESLDLKAGMIYLAGYQQRYFTNLETSKVISSLRLFVHNDYFPVQPFELNRTALKKTYNLKLLERYEDAGTTYLIGFTPIHDDRKSFGGEAWIDSASNHILKIHLKIEDAAIHPFIPLWTNDSIVKVDLDITESFKKRQNELYVDVVNFTYDMQYKNREKTTTHIHTNGVLHMYDLKETFILPFFEYDANLSDYRKISSFPYNEFFWKNRDSIVISEKRMENRNYFEKNGTALKYNMEEWFNRTFFKDNIIRWDPVNRIHIIEIADSIYKNTHPNLPSNLYKLKANIFVDINPNNNNFDILTYTFFDVFESYYRLPLDTATDCFANIYFDILETERLALEKELHKPGLTLDDIRTLYKNRLASIEHITQKYFRETERGQNKTALSKWNDYIYNKLQIDNMKIFGLN